VWRPLPGDLTCVLDISDSATKRKRSESEFARAGLLQVTRAGPALVNIEFLGGVGEVRCTVDEIRSTRG
jgi:hypothetical protein